MSVGQASDFETTPVSEERRAAGRWEWVPPLSPWCLRPWEVGSCGHRSRTGDSFCSEARPGRAPGLLQGGVDASTLQG